MSSNRRLTILLVYQLVMAAVLSILFITIAKSSLEIIGVSILALIITFIFMHILHHFELKKKINAKELDQ